MALINCPECKKQVSEKARGCPGCGYPINITNSISDVAKYYLGYIQCILLVLFVLEICLFYAYYQVRIYNGANIL